MRMHLSVVVGLSLFVLFFLAIIGPAQANVATPQSQPNLIDPPLESFSVQVPITVTLTPTITPIMTPVVTPVMTVTLTPTATPGSMLPFPTATITPNTGMTNAQGVLLYLPALLEGSSASGVGDPSDPCNRVEIVTITICPPNAQELSLAALITTSVLQERTVMVYNGLLGQIARNHAVDMATRGYFGSTDPDGFGPNYRARAAGYVLPDYYSFEPNANNIESILAGHLTAGDVHQVLISGNNQHVFGKIDGYRIQEEYGIGYAYAEDSVHKHYWVILITVQGGASSPAR